MTSPRIPSDSAVLAIETLYNGYLFRSRLEARWAVVFDAQGVRYIYEHQGFCVHGRRLLPDFYLPQSDYHVQVKLEEDADSFATVAYMVASGFRAALVTGVPGAGEHQTLSCIQRENGVEVVRANELWFALPRHEKREEWALRQGRIARFEYGQTPNPIKLREGIGIDGTTRPK